ncbi:translocation and assembly module lipoprotein TamL [Sphingobacterium rhinopitheci]|uniref:translocation and assembly module lipoprotein TamL n=1 Tax=Sphingobacterium rhinopitheci TaxID=2781960 RepID=UPI001F529D27|nr:BamA/TamA family outer membrane protein [Sphingobacterium rhinopitheci]MCI0920010.1 BamA/TamA family outer membrane protein [Sphingobacterium rhinopitheci]
MTTRGRTILFYASIAFLLLIFESCRSARFVEADQALVTHIDMTAIPLALKEQSSSYISNEIRPNSALNLTIYNIFNTKGGRYKKEKIRSVGEPPHILDTSLVELSANQIERFLHTKGYFNATVVPELTIRNKRAKIDFVANMGDPFFYNNISYQIQDSAIRDIYNKEVYPTSLLKKDKQYDRAKLTAEREKLYLAAKDQGYYKFLRQYTRIGVDTNVVGNNADLIFSVVNPDEGKHQVYKINNVSVNIHPHDNRVVSTNSYRDSTTKIEFRDNTSLFRLKPISRYMYLRAGQLYSLANENLSYDRLYEMNGFRSVKINYTEVDSNLLDVTYDLIPRARMSNQVEGEFTFSSGMSGFNIGNTFSHRNVFGGAEVVEVKMRYGVLFDPRLPGSLSQKIFNNDFQVGVNLIVPRLMLPFSNHSSARYGLPRTTFSSSLQLFNQDATYSNKYFINTLNYSWWQTPFLQHSYTPLVLEYRQGKFDEAFKQNLIDEGYRLYVESNNREYFGLGSQYSVTWNAPKLQSLENFTFIRGTVDVSGNTLGVLSHLFNFKTNADNQKTLLKVPYLQYVKGEVDYRLYRYLGGNRQFVFRFNGGLAVPYGNNSELLIFEKSFFAGGMNGIRAWQARTLGPGNYNRSSIQSEQLRLNLRNLDQLGEIKLETNVEYRFRMVNNFLGAKLNGATFVDMGNIWRLRDNPLNQNGALEFNKFFSQIAIGTGFGLRFDMDYFTMRLDAGLKLKDPQFSGKDQWVIKHFFDAKEFKDAYYDSHKPDRYNFIQYNFGIGLPF